MAAKSHEANWVPSLEVLQHLGEVGAIRTQRGVRARSGCPDAKPLRIERIHPFCLREIGHSRLKSLVFTDSAGTVRYRLDRTPWGDAQLRAPVRSCPDAQTNDTRLIDAAIAQ